PCPAAPLLSPYTTLFRSIIPLARFGDLLGLTDLLRLQRGYLLYTGMLRTNVAAMVRSVPVDGKETPEASELFAASGDVHLVLGQDRKSTRLNSSHVQTSY